MKGLAKGDVVSHRGFVVTSPARTLVDLCQTEERATIESSFDEFLRRERLIPERFAGTLERHSRSRGTRFLWALLERGEAPTESELEFRALEILDQQGLPRPEKQVWVKRDRRVDFIYPREKIVVEIDSRAHHFTPKAQEEDAARSNELALNLPGFLLLRWTSLAMKTRPHALARELRLALDRPVLVPYDAA